MQSPKKLGENAYEIELSDEIGISPTFNVSDLYPYKVEEAGAGSDEQPGPVVEADADCREATDGAYTGQENQQKDQMKAILRVSGQMEEPPNGRCLLGK